MNVSRKTWICSLFGAAALVLTLRMVVAFERFSKVERDFDSIQNGQSRASLTAKFGKPNYYSGKCGSMGGMPKDCAAEYVYSHPLAPLLPEYYVVSFSEDGRVIQATHLVSP